MKLSYRTQMNAEILAKHWNKPLDKPDWYAVQENDAGPEIFVYDVIGWPFNDAADLVREMGRMHGEDITFRIHSPGGDLFDGIAIYNAMKSHKGTITTRNDGLAASAASLLMLGGSRRQMFGNSQFMIHEPWTTLAGDQYLVEDVLDVLKKLSSGLVDEYAANSKVGKRELKQMMKDETWMTAKEAKERGFIDEITSGDAIKAEFNLSVFNNVPEQLLTMEAGRELTRKETERALRNAGASRDYARAVAAKGRADTVDEEEAIKYLMTLKSKIKR